MIEQNTATRMVVALEVIDGATSGAQLAECYGSVGFEKCGVVPADKTWAQWDDTVKTLIEEAGGEVNVDDDTDAALREWASKAGEDAVLMAVSTCETHVLAGRATRRRTHDAPRAARRPGARRREASSPWNAHQRWCSAVRSRSRPLEAVGRG